MKQLLHTLFFFLLVTQICFAQLIQTNEQSSTDKRFLTRFPNSTGDNNPYTCDVNKTEFYTKKSQQDNSQKLSELSVINIDSLFQTFMNTYHIPGLAACIIKDDKITWEGYYGYANIALQDSVKASTIFMLASISKTVTASALMQLWEQGRFQLDDSINAYLPFPIRNPHFAWAPITFRHLLTHSSSIRDGYYPYYWGSDPQITLEDYIIGNLTPGGSHYSPENFSDNYPPGAFVSYCNIGVSLCGYLVEVISGIPFDQYCRDSIFIPLGMTNTAWFLRDLDVSLIAHPYTWNGSSYHDYGHYGYASYPDGELRTTVRSLAKWLIANINFGKLGDIRVLDSTTVRLMRTVEFWPPDWSGAGLGLIWQTWAFPDGRWVWYHDGRDYGVSTTMNLDELHKTGVIILTNVNPINEIAFTSLQNTLFSIADTIAVSVGIEGEVNGLPVNWTLGQNYPNPFNPSTKISWQSPVGSWQTLKVYDVLGNEVATLVDEYKPTGMYNVQFTMNNLQLSSGVYFYQLKVGDYIETRKMVLIK